MKIYEKIKIKLKNGELREYRFCDIPFLHISDIYNKKKFKLFWGYGKKITSTKKTFYLKINSSNQYNFMCLQRWINTVDFFDGNIIIICDNPTMEKDILKTIVFPNAEIKFLKSETNSKIKGWVENFASKTCQKIGFAHMTTFYNAKINNIKSFWNIDADDTLLCMSEEEVAKHLKEIEKYADDNNIDCFSLDMHVSRTFGRHWTFGITYTRMEKDWFNIFNSYKDSGWNRKLGLTDYNLDCFFSYLIDCKIIKSAAFYIDNSCFIHWGKGNFLQVFFASALYWWHDNKADLHIVKSVLDDKIYGSYPILDDCVKFNSNLTKSLNEEFLQKQIVGTDMFKQRLLKLIDEVKLNTKASSLKHNDMNQGRKQEDNLY